MDLVGISFLVVRRSRASEKGRWDLKPPNRKYLKKLHFTMIRKVKSQEVVRGVPFQKTCGDTVAVQ